MKTEDINIPLIIEALKCFKSSIIDEEKTKHINESIKYFEAMLPQKEVVAKKHLNTKPGNTYHYFGVSTVNNELVLISQENKISSKNEPILLNQEEFDIMKEHLRDIDIHSIRKEIRKFKTVKAGDEEVSAANDSGKYLIYILDTEKQANLPGEPFLKDNDSFGKMEHGVVE